ncbi:hypothetical protein BFG51_16445 [Dietzia alimentaria]|nr:hypothetical protein BFG51_16445 [Dietzia alimentaria]
MGSPEAVAGGGGEGPRALAGDHDQPVGLPDAPGVEPAVRQGRFHPTQVDPVPEDLGLAPHPPDDLHEAVAGDAGEVPGPQLVEFGPAGEVGRGAGVPHHHVGAAVHQLTGGVRIGSPRTVDAEGAAGDRDPDGPRTGPREVRGEVRHARGRLGLAVHHDQFCPARLQVRGQATHRLGREAPARLGEVAQAGEAVQSVETDALEEFDRVRDGGERRHLPGLRPVPERRCGDGVGVEHHGRACQQVTVQDGQAVAVVRRQGGDRPVPRHDAQVVHDRPRVGQHRPPGLPDELGCARGPGGAQEQCEVGMQVVPRRCREHPGREGSAVPRDNVGVPCREEVVGGRALRRQEEHDVAGGVGGEIVHEELDGVRRHQAYQATTGRHGRVLGGALGAHPGERGVGVLRLVGHHGDRGAAPGGLAEQTGRSLPLMRARDGHAPNYIR